MARFVYSTQKFDQHGNKIPKGLNGIKQYCQDNPNTVIFDSKSEYDLYLKLRDLELEGVIANLQCKKKFLLVEQTKWFNNVKQKTENIRELCYITDFVFERDGQKIAVDCKGWRLAKDKKTGKEKWNVYYDDVYKLKKKMFLAKYQGEYIFEEM